MNHRVLCSYSLKTLMLWKCEQEPDDYWDETRLNEVVRSLLLCLVGWLIERKCPHYFIRTHNNWCDAPEWSRMEDKIELFVRICEKKLIEDCIADSPMAARQVFSPEDLNRATHKMLLNWIGYGVHSNILDVNKVMSQEMFESLSSGIRNLYRGIAIQKLCSAEIAQQNGTNIGVVSDLLMEAENAFDKVCDFKNDDELSQVSLPESAIQFSFVEFLLKMMKYYISKFEKDLQIGRKSLTFDENYPTVAKANPNYLSLLLKTVDLPRLHYFIGVCYLANFYYACAKNYTRAIEVCSDAITRVYRSKQKRLRFNRGINWMLLTNKQASIYDAEIQTVLGYLILAKSVKSGIGSINNSPVRIFIPPDLFLCYVRSRCLKLKSNTKELDIEHLFKLFRLMDEISRPNVVGNCSTIELARDLSCFPVEQFLRNHNYSYTPRGYTDTIRENNEKYSDVDIQLAYQANFYHTSAKDCARSLDICDNTLPRLSSEILS